MGRSGPVSAQVAEAMAQAARLRFDADAGTGVVSEPTPSSGPVGTCWIGIALGDKTTSVSGSYPTQRLRIKRRAVAHALLELVRLLKE